MDNLYNKTFSIRDSLAAKLAHLAPPQQEKRSNLIDLVEPVDRRRHSFSHHHFDELFVVDLAITIHVCLPNHFVDFLIREFLAQVRHDVAQLGCADETVSITIENLEGLDELLFRVCVFHLSCHERQELRE